jgi:hypothetical protein
MGALIAAFAPILVLMALPLVIPAVALGIGALRDRFAPRDKSAAESIVVAAQERSALVRHELEQEHARILAQRP